jgi:hypothetical protein
MTASRPPSGSHIKYFNTAIGGEVLREASVLSVSPW